MTQACRYEPKIQRTYEADRNGFGVIETFCGHGIGAALHMQPQVACVGRPGTGMKLKEGMVLYIMAMFAEHSPELDILDDGWTAVTRDRGLCATAARMVAIGAKGPILLPEGLGSDSPLVRPRLTGPSPGATARPRDAETAEKPRTRPWYARLFGRS